MTETTISPEIYQHLCKLQQDEINSYFTYLKLAEITRDQNNQVTFKKIANQEMFHYQTWKRYTHQNIQPDRLKIQFHYWIAKILGLTFGVKLMEKGEEQAQKQYHKYLQSIPEFEQVLNDEQIHENELLNMIDEESLKYAGSVVLGLNDALVELTGALAGFTFAFQNTRLIALAGLITGISASLSMSASEYLSTKSEAGEQNPTKAAVYTGIAYVLTVIALIAPYLVFKNYALCLGITILVAILIIATFNYYISIAKDLPFHKRFAEMSAISLGVAFLSFLIGILVRQVFGIDI